MPAIVIHYLREFNTGGKKWKPVPSLRQEVREYDDIDMITIRKYKEIFEKVRVGELPPGKYKALLYIGGNNGTIKLLFNNYFR